LDDGYFRGGDVLKYCWWASDDGNATSPLPTGLGTHTPASVEAAEAATGGLFEASFLPKINWDSTYRNAVRNDPTGHIGPTVAQMNSSLQATTILYVNRLNPARRSGNAQRTSFMVMTCPRFLYQLS